MSTIASSTGTVIRRGRSASRRLASQARGAARWISRAFPLWMTIVLALAAFAPLGPSAAGAAAALQDGPILLTDRTGYQPGDTVHITGVGFAPGEYALPVMRPDGSTAPGAVIADEAGGPAYDYLPDGGEGSYEARAYSAGWSGDWGEAPLASVTFTVAPPPAPTGTPVPSETPTPEPTPPAPPAIQSDKPDYAPGETVTLTGANWQPGEAVNLFINDDYGSTWSLSDEVMAGEDG